MRVLIVDDEPHIRQTLRIALESMGHATGEAVDSTSARHQVQNSHWDAALIDLRLGSESGLDLMEEILRGRQQLAVVVITAYSSIDRAVEAMRRGAFDFLPKPFTPDQIRAVLERIRQIRGLRDRLADLEEQVRSEVPEVALESSDPQVDQLLDQARRVAATNAVVLIRGESGTGKGILARRLHAWSQRSAGPFVTVSCPSLNADLLESELFGHTRGSFTGAVRDTQGKVAAAEGGTLFLDEVGDLPLSLQPKLLRFLQERKYERVGDTRIRTADVRLIAATNRDLDAEAASGRFRDDLLYRLNVVEFKLPPLRERTDVLELADHLLRFFCRQTGRKPAQFTGDAARVLSAYSWPGNLRELRNSVERAVIFTSGTEITLEGLPERITSASASGLRRIEVGSLVTLEEIETEHIRRILLRLKTLDEAARVLGVDPSTLYRKRKHLGL